MNADTLGPRVIEVEELQREPLRPSAGPQVFATERTDRIVPVEPAPLRIAATAKHSRGWSVGAVGLGVFVAGWLAIDSYWWIAAAFERSGLLGSLAAAVVAAGVIGAGTIAWRELRSLSRLRSVEDVRARLAADVIRPRDASRIIADILSVVPKERDNKLAIDAFARQVQPHHTVSQQVQILSRTVMVPLDRRAEAHIRAAVLRAFGITAVSPTAMSDAAFFLAVGVRMVRGIAAAYGHRPTAAATTHLVRRLVVEAGKLGAIDIASNTIAQHLGGAVAERVAATAADSFYASYRMARLGIVVMDLCRPVPFRDDDVPSVSALVSNAIRTRNEVRQ